MNQATQAIRDDVSQLAEDAQALLSATADVTGEKVGAALERGRELYDRVREKAVAGARATDEAVHQHPYQAIALGLAAGALLGCLLARRCSHHCNRSE